MESLDWIPSTGASYLPGDVGYMQTQRFMYRRVDQRARGFCENPSASVHNASPHATPRVYHFAELPIQSPNANIVMNFSIMDGLPKDGCEETSSSVWHEFSSRRGNLALAYS